MPLLPVTRGYRATDVPPVPVGARPQDRDFGQAPCTDCPDRMVARIEELDREISENQM